MNVVMPKLGMTMTQATIVDWYAEDGDDVSKGDVLFTLETEKSTLDIEAPASGILHHSRPGDGDGAGQDGDCRDRVGVGFGIKSERRGRSSYRS